jgi:colicin import membrane protein
VAAVDTARLRRPGRIVPGVLLAAVLLAPTAAPARPDARLEDVSVVRQRGAVVVKVRTSTRPRYVSQVVADPPRVIVDFSDTRYAWRTEAWVVGQPPVKEIRGRQLRRGVARLVVELTRRAPVRLLSRPDGLHIVVPAASAATRPAVRPPATRPPAPAAGVTTSGGAGRSGGGSPAAPGAAPPASGSATSASGPAPAAPEPRARSAPGATEPLRLQGIVMVDGVAVAYIEEPAARPVRGYRVGDPVGDGRVEAISADTVVIRRPSGQVELKITPRPGAPAKP